MARVVEGLFSSYEFEDEEEYAAKILSDLQDKHIQNETALAFEKKLRIKLMPGEEANDEFLKEHKYWEGFTDALIMLRMISNEMHQGYLEKLRETPEEAKD